MGPMYEIHHACEISNLPIATSMNLYSFEDEELHHCQKVLFVGYSLMGSEIILGEMLHTF